MPLKPLLLALMAGAALAGPALAQPEPRPAPARIDQALDVALKLARGG